MRLISIHVPNKQTYYSFYSKSNKQIDPNKGGEKRQKRINAQGLLFGTLEYTGNTEGI